MISGIVFVKKLLSRSLLKLFGWELDDQLPELKCYVLIAYPHTSNWDFVLGMLAKWSMDLPLNWVAKHSMFWGPFKPLFLAMGGVPLNRQQSSGFIQKNIELFEQREHFVLGLMPEGTRSKTDRWKTGFYHIAHGANVPIVLAYLDYKTKHWVLVLCYSRVVIYMQISKLSKRFTRTRRDIGPISRVT